MFKKNQIGIAALLVLPIGWVLFLMQNLPFATLDDPTLLYIANKVSFTKILSRIINPLTPAWTYQFASGGAEQNALGLRPIPLLLWKSSLAIFGYKPSPLHWMKGISLSLIGVFIYYYTYVLTKKKSVSILTSLFYCATLPVFMSVFFISDFGMLAQFFQGLAAIFFINMWMQNEKLRLSSKDLLLKSALLFLLAWLAIKTYEPTKILPILLISFVFILAVKSRLKWFGIKKNWIIVLGILLMFILVIPVTKSFVALDQSGNEFKGSLLPKYHWDTLYRFLIQNTRNAWEAEPDIAFFSLKSRLPFSVARTFGFFLLWTTTASMVLIIINTKKILPDLNKKQRLFILFLSLWLLADIAALGLPKESDGRHLMVPLIPLSIFTGTILYYASKTIPSQIRRGFIGLCIFAWGYAFFANLDHQIYFRKFMGGLQIAQHQYLSFIYEDFHGKKPNGYPDLIDFQRVPEELCIWHIPFIVDDNYSQFDMRTKEPYLRKIAKEHGKAYVVTPDGNKVSNHSYLKKIGEFSEINNSLFTDIILRFKKKKGGTRHVYKYSGWT